MSEIFISGADTHMHRHTLIHIDTDTHIYYNQETKDTINISKSDIYGKYLFLLHTVEIPHS